MYPNPIQRQKRTYHFAKHVPCDHRPEEKKPSMLRVVVVRVNIVKPLASLVFGKDHSTFNRLLAGTAVMAFGVMIAKYIGHSPNALIAHFGDGIGYGLHGIGLIPFIEAIASKFE